MTHRAEYLIHDHTMEFIQSTDSRQHTLSLHMAVLIKRGKIVATATNKVGTRSKGSGYSEITLHAEKAVIKKLGDISKLKDCSLYVWRIGFAEYHPMTSEPCHSCKKFLEKCMEKYGLRGVYYTHTNTPMETSVPWRSKVHVPSSMRASGQNA
jgi:tRNA(Arg) A34 adenosine deaminase TadA